MRHLVRNALLTLIVLSLLGISIFPPETKLRLGKDLSGGVSLVYSVQIDPNDNADDVLSQTIDVLKKRVDPNGQMDITMVAQGRDRIEITMPMPSERVAELRDRVEESLAGLNLTDVDSGTFDQIMRLPEPERTERLEALPIPDAVQALTVDAVDAYEEALGYRADLEKAEADGLDADAIDELLLGVARAENKYEAARGVVISSVISVDDVRRILRLSDLPIYKMDDLTKEAFEIPSPRSRAWAQLIESHPEREEQLEAVKAQWVEYESERRTLDDPQDLIRLLEGAGVLDFRITCDPGAHPDEARLRQELREIGPRNVESMDAAWYKINRIDNWFNSLQELRAIETNAAAFFIGRDYVVEPYDGEYYMLCWDKRGSRLTQAEGGWAIAGANVGVDRLGRPAIDFRMDARGAKALGKLTEAHVSDSMAVLLDDEVYTAPNLLGRIATSGQISGDFSDAERRYIINVLAAGSLQARLSAEPISVSTIGPDLGLDNLQAGLKAGKLSLLAVSVFMVGYYFIAGGVAVLTLVCSAIIILGMMSLNRAAFTLPGIAGVVLTFGMAVDANVLIYERIREELSKGADVKAAVRTGFQKAMSSIVDGNVTNLIVCFVLAYTGTQEIRGFAITLGIGVVATLFSALVVARILFAILLEWFNLKDIHMLPRSVPLIDRILEPKVNWMKLRFVFVGISLLYVSLGLSMIISQGSSMLDNDFLGGTQVTLRFASKDTGDPILLERGEVEERVHSLADGLEEGDGLIAIRNADVLVIGPDKSGMRSDTFTIKTTSLDSKRLLDGLRAEFQEELAELPSLQFLGRDTTDYYDAPVHKLLAGNIGRDTGMPSYFNDVRDWQGGVVILLEDITPAASVRSIRERIETMVNKEEFREGLGRQRDVILLTGTAEAATAVAVVALDPLVSCLTQSDRFDGEVGIPEWRLIQTAMKDATTPASVQTYSPAIAATFQAQAVVAVVISLLGILIYIWVRFGSVRYSFAAIITLLHDVLTAIGLIAVAEILYDMPAAQGIVRSLGIMPFKIDLSLVAAILTIIGYSLNDTIVIMDRIRENRGKLDYASTKTINDSINQTISRTVITSGTTLIATLILYIYGGEGVRAFSYALIIGIVIGTYSSIAVAAPLVWSRREDKSDREAAEGVDGLVATT